MNAVVFHRYGSPEVVEVTEVPKPQPTDDQVLVKVHAASINPVDWHRMRGEPTVMRLSEGLTKPKNPRLGADLAGTVEAIGKDVTEFRPGDEVFGMSIKTLAEYASVAREGLVAMGPALTFEQAGTMGVAGITAVQGLRDHGNLRPGQRVLINGAAGGVGTFAVQIAKALGGEVTGVCSTRNLEMVRELGADHVIDYTKEDFTQGKVSYDLILDCVGNRSLTQFRRVLSPTGSFVIVGAAKGRWIAPLLPMVKARLLSFFVSQKLGAFLAKRKQPDLAFLKELVEAGKLTPVIDRVYPLSQVAEAITYLEEGHARGKVVVKI